MPSEQEVLDGLIGACDAAISSCRLYLARIDPDYRTKPVMSIARDKIENCLDILQRRVELARVREMPSLPE